jgi:hypothetical protein
MTYSVYRELLQKELRELGVFTFCHWDHDEARDIHYYWAFFHNAAPTDHCVEPPVPGIPLDSYIGEVILQGALEGKIVLCSALLNGRLDLEIAQAVEKYTL